MTIKEFAQEQNISVQAVYKRLKAAKIDISGIKDETTGELSEKGLTTLINLFSKKTSNESGKKTDYLSTISGLQREVEKLKEDLEEERKEKEEWKRQAGSWEESARQAQEVAAGIQQTVNRLQDALQEAQKTAQQAQALNMATIKTMPALNPPARHGGLLRRLFGRTTNKRQEDTEK